VFGALNRPQIIARTGHRTDASARFCRRANNAVGQHTAGARLLIPRTVVSFSFQYLDFDNLPDTNFSCDGKVIGGYYADVETGCQMFHVCTIGQKGKPLLRTITSVRAYGKNATRFDFNEQLSSVTRAESVV